MKSDVDSKINVFSYFRFSEFFAIFVEGIILIKILIFFFLHSSLLPLLIFKFGISAPLIFLFICFGRLSLVIPLFMVIVFDDVLIGLS